MEVVRVFAETLQLPFRATPCREVAYCFQKDRDRMHRTTVRLPNDLHRRAKLAATWSGKTLQDFVTEALESHLELVEKSIRESGLSIPRTFPAQE